MLFVPVTPTVTSSPPPSPRVRELAQLLNKVVDEYSAAHPSVSRTEIQQAIRLAQASAPGGSRPAALVVMATLGVLVAGLFLGLFLLADGGNVDFQGIAPIAIAVVILFLGVALMVVKAASR